MANRNYKTARGVNIDIDTLRLVNDRVIAVGNMGTNARGDQVDKEGNITKPRSEIMKENYKINARLIRDTPKKPTAPTSSPASKPTFLNAESPQPAPAPSPLRGALASAVAAQKIQTIAPPEETEVTSGEQPGTEADEFSELLTSTPNNRTLKRI